MQDGQVSPHVAVRLDVEERRAVAGIMVALTTPRRPKVTMSDAIRVAVREMHSTVLREAAQ